MGPDVLSDSVDRITQVAVEESPVKLVPAGSIAVVVRSGILERHLPVAVVPFEATFNQDMKAVVPASEVDARWIAWGLRSVEGEILRKCRKAGTTVASIEFSKLKHFTIRVPPLLVQKHVIDLIEDHFTRLDSADRSLSDGIEKLRALREVHVISAILGGSTGETVSPEQLEAAGTIDGDLAELPSGWRWARLGDVAEVRGGVTKDAKKQNDPTFVEVPYLRVANVQRASLDLSEVTAIRISSEKATALRLEPGDVLLNEGGDRDKLARGWVWEGQIEGCIHQNHVFRARPKPGIDPYFLSWTANTLGGKWAEVNGRQSVNLASISLRTIRKMPVIVPPLEVAKRAVNELHEKLADLTRAEEAFEAARQRSAGLRRAVLTAAFSGRLTGHRVDDEIIEELAEV